MRFTFSQYKTMFFRMKTVFACCVCVCVFVKVLESMMAGHTLKLVKVLNGNECLNRKLKVQMFGACKKFISETKIKGLFTD